MKNGHEKELNNRENRDNFSKIKQECNEMPWHQQQLLYSSIKKIARQT
jgi:hypothetical protein